MRCSCETKKRKHEAQYLTLYLLLVLAARNAPMTADVGLDVYLRYDHHRNLEDVRAFACRQGLREDVIPGQIRASAWDPLSKEAPSGVCNTRVVGSEDEPKYVLDKEK